MASWLSRLFEYLVWRPVASLLSIPARPWTFEIRHWCSRHPLGAIVILGVTVSGWFTAQIEFVMAFGWYAAPLVAFADSLAFFAGHLFWGKCSHTADRSGYA